MKKVYLLLSIALLQATITQNMDKAATVQRVVGQLDAATALAPPTEAHTAGPLDDDAQTFEQEHATIHPMLDDGETMEDRIAANDKQIHDFETEHIPAAQKGVQLEQQTIQKKQGKDEGATPSIDTINGIRAKMQQEHPDRPSHLKEALQPHNDEIKRLQGKRQAARAERDKLIAHRKQLVEETKILKEKLAAKKAELAKVPATTRPEIMHDIMELQDALIVAHATRTETFTEEQKHQRTIQGIQDRILATERQRLHLMQNPPSEHAALAPIPAVSTTLTTDLMHNDTVRAANSQAIIRYQDTHIAAKDKEAKASMEAIQKSKDETEQAKKAQQSYLQQQVATLDLKQVAKRIGKAKSQTDFAKKIDAYVTPPHWSTVDASIKALSDERDQLLTQMKHLAEQRAPLRDQRKPLQQKVAKGQQEVSKHEGDPTFDTLAAQHHMVQAQAREHALQKQIHDTIVAPRADLAQRALRIQQQITELEQKKLIKSKPPSRL